MTIELRNVVREYTVGGQSVRALDEVSLRLAHLPRPGNLAKLLDVASVGVGALTDVLPV